MLATGSCKYLKRFKTPKGRTENVQPVLSFNKSYSVSKRNNTSLEQLINRYVNNGVHSSELMLLSSPLAAFLTMYELTDSVKYLEQAYDLSNRVVASAKVSSRIEGNQSNFNDQYLTWINLNPKFEETKRGSPGMREYPLYESYFFRYMAKMLYMTAQTKGKTKGQFQNDYNHLLNFLRINGWEKWYERGKKVNDCNPFIFRSRTHMACQWGVVALYLSELEDDNTRKLQYTTFLDKLNAQLRDNLKITSKGAYKWNMTWDSEWPLGTQCNKPIKPIIQDGSHGNHVINYVVSCYELGRYWNETDIKRFVRTTSTLLYNKQESYFYGDLNQKYDKSYLGGLRFGDGFIKLARYDKPLLLSFERARIVQSGNYHFRYEEAQYVAEFLLAQKYH